MTLTRLTAIDGETILPLEDAKAHLRVTHDDEDALIEALRDAACEYVERVSGVALADADYLWEGSCFSRVSALPLRPVTAVGSVAYTDGDGASATYTGARIVNGSVLPAFGESWPSAYGYAAITFSAGTTCPPDLLAAVKLMLGHLYANREAVNIGNITSEVPLGVDALIQTYRKVMV
ncbi:MAG: head-tail connector protein [Tsuneonella sp.]